MNLTLLFENEHFIAVDKPSASLTTPSRMGAEDPRPCLSTALQEKMGRIFPVHRLDFEVSGVVLFARNPKAHAAANKWWETRFVSKIYEAFSHDLNNAVISKEWQTWQSQLIRGKRRAYESKVGQQAVTEAQYQGTVIERPGKVLRWSLRPLTGRAHQLRYEMAKHGYPIIGDYMYGATELKKPDLIALRAVKLDFRNLSDRHIWQIPDVIETSALSLKDYQ